MAYKKKEQPKLTDTFCACGCGRLLLDYETLFGKYKAGHLNRRYTAYKEAIANREGADQTQIDIQKQNEAFRKLMSL